MQQHLMQMQMQMQMQPMMAAYYPSSVTTDHIQQYLDENKSLILKIVESQNSGKMSECAENQARLQRNLMYLAAIADSQPQPPSAMHPQFSTSGIMQAGGHYTQQHQQAQQMTPQALVAARSSMVYSQQPLSALQQQQALHSLSSGRNPNLHILQTQNNPGPNSTLGAATFADFGRTASGEALRKAVAGGGSKQDIGNSASIAGRARSPGGDGGETLYLKAADDGN